MARDLYRKARIVRRLSAFASFDDAESNDRREWRRMSVTKRLEIVEQLRQLNHADYDPATPVPRVYTVGKSRTKRSVKG